VFWASALCLTGKYGDLLDFVVIIVLIFIYLILGIFILRRKCQMLKDRIELLISVLPALYIIVASAICIALLYTKTSNERLGCCDYANWYSSLLFDKG
jgi:APA family basic amino acid/polyamine antiporter